MVNIEPSSEHPMPYDTHREKTESFHDSVVVAANTADLLKQLGAPIEIDAADLKATADLFKTTDRSKARGQLQQPNTAFAASLFLKTYANRIAADMNEVRSAITAKLMEIANCGDPRYELKALELLGKHSDIGLFTERSEITIHHKSSGDLESAIKERIKRLLNAETVDVTPLADSLDDELGVADQDPRDLISQLDPDPSDNDSSDFDK